MSVTVSYKILWHTKMNNHGLCRAIDSSVDRKIRQSATLALRSTLGKRPTCNDSHVAGANVAMSFIDRV